MEYNMPRTTTQQCSKSMEAIGCKDLVEAHPWKTQWRFQQITGSAKHVLREMSQGIVVSVGHGSFKNQIGTLVWVTMYVYILNDLVGFTQSMIEIRNNGITLGACHGTIPWLGSTSTNYDMLISTRSKVHELEWTPHHVKYHCNNESRNLTSHAGRRLTFHGPWSHNCVGKWIPTKCPTPSTLYPMGVVEGVLCISSVRWSMAWST